MSNNIRSNFTHSHSNRHVEATTRPPDRASCGAACCQCYCFDETAVVMDSSNSGRSCPQKTKNTKFICVRINFFYYYFVAQIYIPIGRSVISGSGVSFSSCGLQPIVVRTSRTIVETQKPIGGGLPTKKRSEHTKKVWHYFENYIIMIIIPYTRTFVSERKDVIPNIGKNNIIGSTQYIN